MSTKSILKNININDDISLNTFLNALDKAESISCKKVELSKKSVTLKVDSVKEFFK